MEQKLQKEFKKVEDTRVAEASASAHGHTRQECDEESDEEIQVISSDDEEKHELPHHSSIPSEQEKQVVNLPSPPEEPQNPQVPVPLLFRPWQTHIPQIQIRRSSIFALQRNQQNNPEDPNLDNQQMEKVLPLPGTSYPVDNSARSEVASQLQEHKKSNEDSAKSVPNRSDFTGSMAKLTTHRNDEWPTYPCTECDRQFGFKCDLTNHMRMHTGERPFQCSKCGYRCSQKSNLKLHERIHSDDRPFICLTCNRGFKLKSTLDVHQTLHSSESPFKCDICEKSFRRKQSLMDHKNTHTGERSYECDLCHKTYYGSSALSKHRKQHKEEESRRSTI